MVETKALPPQESQLRDLDGFVLRDSRIIYLRRDGPTLVAAEVLRRALRADARRRHLA